MRVDAVEVTGYPDLVRQYAISGVPKTVLAEGVELVGAPTEAMLLAHVERAAASGNGKEVS